MLNMFYRNKELLGKYSPFPLLLMETVTSL